MARVIGARATAMAVILSAAAIHAAELKPVTFDDQAAGPADISLTDADVFVDAGDAKVIQLAGGLLADDIERVTGHRPAVKPNAADLGRTAVLIGTIGQSAVIDRLIADKKIDTAVLREQAETFGWFVVEKPLPNVERALVIAGADRRGTAYGVTEISKRIGVSPWYWWADVAPAKHQHLRATGGQSIEAAPKVKYRGIFINDEDFGFRPWGMQIDDGGGTKRIGPKAYAHVFELMLRLRLNYIWPAMHPGSGEFTAVPGNAEMADDWAIVTGASHCEPMLRNNVYWPKTDGEWRYDTNTQKIHEYWEWAAKNRGPFEAVWTIGIRGIHDEPMKGPKEVPARVSMVENIFADQQKLIADNVTQKYGPPAQCFVPYKEVLPLYEAGLKVPDNAIIVWPDDNFGYIRRLASEAERARSGGTGVYYHISYWGSPHSYLWVQTTSPGLIWEEMHKAYENGSKALWIVNVGDIKPGEIAIDFWSQLAWNPEQFGPDAQRVFLDRFCTDTFGAEAGPKVKTLLDHYYAVGAMRRPEHLSYVDAGAMRQGLRARMLSGYDALLQEEAAVAETISADRRDAYFETVGYAARVLAATGRLYLGDPADQAQWKRLIDKDTARYNEQTGGGKWQRMMALNQNGMQWPEALGGKLKPRPATQPRKDEEGVVIDAASGRSLKGARTWQVVDGVGWSGHAVTPLPTTAVATDAPLGSLAYDFTLPDAVSDASIGFEALPTMRLTQEHKLRIGVAIDGGSAQTIDVPGGEATSENAKIRSDAVVMNRKSFDVPVGQLAPGKHTLTVTVVDPGVVLDQIRLPTGATVAK